MTDVVESDLADDRGTAASISRRGNHGFLFNKLFDHGPLSTY